MDGAYAEIVVVRHGETEWNADGRIQVWISWEVLHFLKYLIILYILEFELDLKMSNIDFFFLEIIGYIGILNQVEEKVLLGLSSKEKNSVFICFIEA